MVDRRYALFIFGILILSVFLGFVSSTGNHNYGFCGDGSLDSDLGEECDKGIYNGFLCWAGYGSSCDYCTNSCKTKTITNYCGDGITQTCEECDGGENCSEDCLMEVSENETEEPEEPSCMYNLSVRESYSNSYGTGIAIRDIEGDWIEGSLNLSAGNYEIKYFVDNEGDSEIENVSIELKINDNVVSNSLVSINKYKSYSYVFNSSEYCGEGLISVTASKNNDCSLENNYADREFYVQCKAENPSEPPLPPVNETTPSVCGNNIIETGEECDGGDDCSSQCKLIEDEDNSEGESERNTGGIVSVSTCEPNWVCSGWGECSDGHASRNCVDTNNCDFEYNKPLESMYCDSLSQVKIDESSESRDYPKWIIIETLILILILIILVNIPRNK